MAARQVFLPERNLRASVDGRGVYVATRVRRNRYDLPALSVGLGPGDRLFALCADRNLWQVGAPRPLRAWQSINAFSADPRLLAAVQDDQRLLLEDEWSGTSLALPARPKLFRALGGTGALPHLGLVALDDVIWLFAWPGGDESIQLTELFRGEVADGALLEGPVALVALRERARFGASPLRLWLVACKEGHVQTTALAPLLLDEALPLGLRNGLHGPSALCTTGNWAVWHTDHWGFEPGRVLAQALVVSRIYGSFGALEPLPPIFDKEHLP